MAKSRFEGINLSPNLQRIQRVFINQMREAMQEYIDELDSTIKLQADGRVFEIPEQKVVELFNDFLLYSNGGNKLEKEVVSNVAGLDN